MSSASSTFAAGQSPTAIQFNGWAQGTLGYAQVTANQGSITSEVDLTSLTVTVLLVAGRRIRIVGSVRFSSTAVGDAVILNIKEGSTVLQQAQGHSAVAGQDDTLERSVVIQPSAGSHTYKLSMQRAAGTGTITMGAGSGDPAFILVEDIGAV